MEIAFDTRNLRRLVESQKGLRGRFGAEAAENLMTLFSDLRVADSIHELIDVDLCFSTGASHVLTLSVGAGARVVIEPNHAVVPVSDKGEVAWEAVYSIRVREIMGASS